MLYGPPPPRQSDISLTNASRGGVIPGRAGHQGRVNTSGPCSVTAIVCSK